MSPYISLERIILMAFTGSLASCAETPIRAIVGQNITLPCNYDTAEHGMRTVCWGKGGCPASWCSSTIVWIQEQHVDYEQSSSKYQIMGNVNRGDVSLTIMDVTQKDRGTYCCRVDIYGWFNDHKNHIELVVETDHLRSTPTAAPATTSFTESYSFLETRWTLTTPPVPTNISVHIEEQKSGKASRTSIYIASGICTTLLIVVMLLLLKWMRQKKQKLSNSISQVSFSTAEIGTGIQHTLETRVRAPENIYEFY